MAGRRSIGRREVIERRRVKRRQEKGNRLAPRGSDRLTRGRYRARQQGKVSRTKNRVTAGSSPTVPHSGNSISTLKLLASPRSNIPQTEEPDRETQCDSFRYETPSPFPDREIEETPPFPHVRVVIIPQSVLFSPSFSPSSSFLMMNECPI